MRDGEVDRREALKLVAAAAVATSGCARHPNQGAMDTGEAILSVSPLGFPWATSDPFLFCVHHDDRYPAGDDRQGPASSLAGRNLGQDFEGKDGWRMYHGQVVPGFPQHPHRGFETVTVVRRGLLDHSDSLGATARYGGGDVQWLTAGKGILHAEMFPLVNRDAANPLELFQIWLNLPAARKMVEPHFSMFWSRDIPHQVAMDSEGRPTEVAMVAGRLGERAAPQPPPDSWASQPDADVAIWTLRMAPGARWTIPAAAPGSNRSLYFFRGSTLTVDGRAIGSNHRVELRADRAVALVAGSEETEALLLQGRPIGEPVVNYGPFVMNSPAEIRQAILDYQRTQFGGWPWPSAEPVHGREEGRFARYAGGRLERPG